MRQHNKRQSRGLEKFRMKQNFLADLSEIERRNMATGNIIPEEEFNDFVVRGRAVQVINGSTIPAGPAQVDWRAKGVDSPVKDQGFFCNSCYAYSAIAALEAHWFLKTGQLVSLSEQQIIDCNRNLMTGNWGCAGGSQAAAYMYVYGNDGIANVDSYPNQEQTEHNGTYSCRYNPTSRAATTTGYFRIRPGNETLLRDVVAAKGPVAAAMDGTMHSFYFYA